jgi:hypothetical protein
MNDDTYVSSGRGVRNLAITCGFGSSDAQAMEIIVTNPRRYRDPRSSDQRFDTLGDARARMPAMEPWNATWGWIAGALAAVFVMAVAYGAANKSSTTASFEVYPPAATTGAWVQAIRPRGLGFDASPPADTTGAGSSSPGSRPVERDGAP